MTLSDTTESFLKDRFSAPEQSTVLVGVSGGPDSMVLLDVLFSLRETFGYELTPLHVNYRFHDRADDAFSVLSEYCRARKLTPIAVSVREPGRHREAAEGLEARARALRFDFFERCASERDEAGLFLAQHRKDQVETVLLNLGRGCGPGALSGMAPEMVRDELTVYRPFLAAPKKAILEYANQRNIPYVLDPTNDDEGYARNRIRHSVLPEWERAQPAPVEAVSNLTDRVARENDFWQKYIDDKLTDFHWPNEVQVDRQSFFASHPAVQFRYLRSMVEALNGSLKGWSERNLRDVRELFAEGRSGAQLSLPGECHALNEYDRGCLFTSDLERSGTEAEPKSLPDTLDWLGAGVIDVVRTRDETVDSDDLALEVAERQLERFRFRTWERGDTVQLDGSSTKLKELFDDRKIPYRARRYWPILVDEEKIIGLPGLVGADTSGGSVRIRFRSDHPAFHQLENRYTF